MDTHLKESQWNNISPSGRPDLKQRISQEASLLGFDVCGFAKAETVSAEAQQQYQHWLNEHFNDCMDYAERYMDVRSNPDLLFPGAKTVISVAMNYYPEQKQSAEAAQFAYYAYGRDYHEVVRERLQQLSAFIENATGATSRVCVDTAPIREKYWAWRAGLGFIGRNSLLIVPGRGSFFFLGELVTTLELPPDSPCNVTCGTCHECVDHCPGKALGGDGTVDARRCLSCQLIERRGDLPTWVADAKGNKVYGCDECQKCCPHNRFATPTTIPDFAPSEALLHITFDEIRNLSPEAFRELFRHSAVKRAKLAGLQRNAE